MFTSLLYSVSECFNSTVAAPPFPHLLKNADSCDSGQLSSVELYHAHLPFSLLSAYFQLTFFLTLGLSFWSPSLFYPVLEGTMAAPPFPHLLNAASHLSSFELYHGPELTRVTCGLDCPQLWTLSVASVSITLAHQINGGYTDVRGYNGISESCEYRQMLRCLSCRPLRHVSCQSKCDSCHSLPKKRRPLAIVIFASYFVQLPKE